VRGLSANSHKTRKSSQGFHKTFSFFDTQPMRPLGHLFCTDFDHFWNKRRDSVSAWVPW